MSPKHSKISRRKFLSRGTLAAASVIAAATDNLLSSAGTEKTSAEKNQNTIRVAACQILTYADIQKSTQKIIKWMEAASKENSDVVSFPEAALCGYQCDDEYWKKANPKDFQNGEAQVIEASRRLNIAVILGTAYWENNRLYDGLLVIDKGGKVRGRYAKTHLAEKWPVPGKLLPIYTVAGVKSCFIICHDVRYPELVRLPAAAGAQVCYFCSCESGLLSEYKLSAYRAMPIARATENTIYCIMANAPADPENMNSPSQSHGNSKIIHPDGNVLEEAGFFEETLVTATIDIDKATRKIAKRASEDDTILKHWLNQGVKLVKNLD
jgi:predicted amidohydrolase